MANALYSKGIQNFLNGNISWTNDTIRAALVTSGYTPALSTDQYFSTISTADVLGTSPAFSSKTVTSGIADAGNVTFTSPAAGTATYVAVYQDTGVPATSCLIALIDTASGLPVTLDGSTNVLIAWDSGSNKIFAL